MLQTRYRTEIWILPFHFIQWMLTVCGSDIDLRVSQNSDPLQGLSPSSLHSSTLLAVPPQTKRFSAAGKGCICQLFKTTILIHYGNYYQLCLLHWYSLHPSQLKTWLRFVLILEKYSPHWGIPCSLHVLLLVLDPKTAPHFFLAIYISGFIYLLFFFFFVIIL